MTTNLKTYTEFFRNTVLRKKQDLVNPRFHGIGEVILPRNSEIHFLPKNPVDFGPSNSEAFISNYPKEVYIDFVLKTPEYVMGNGRLQTMEIPKAINGYRAGHYGYNWTKDINTVYRKEQVLVVKNYGLIPHRLIYRPSVYMGYEKYYNLQLMMLQTVNEQVEKGNRKQFIRIELPLVLPSFTELGTDYKRFITSFKNGLPVLTPQVLSSTKGEGSYWLLDMLAWLVGQYEYSLFSTLSEKALSETQLIFTFQSKALVLNLGLLKEWLESTNPKEKKEYASAQAEFEGIKGGTRMNAVKRIYLSLMGLSRNLVSEKEIIKEEFKDGNKETQTDPEVVEGEDGIEEKGSEVGNSTKGKSAGENVNTDAGSGSTDFADVFNVAETDNQPADGITGTSEPNGADGSVEEWTSEVNDDLLETEKVNYEIHALKDPFATPESGVIAALEEKARDGGVTTVAEMEFFRRKGERYKHIEMPNGQSFEEFIQVTPEELKDVGGYIEGNFLTILDESMLRARATSLKLDYPGKFLHKDIARMFLGIQNAGYAMNDFKMERHTSVEGAYDVFSVQYHHPNGEQSTIHPRFPVVDDDGTFIVDGVKQHQQAQRREKPFRKISPSKVALVSYYDRKLMIQRSEKAVDDLSHFMVKQISLIAKTGKISVSKGSAYNDKYKSSRIYSLLAKQYKWIKVDGLTFDFQIDDLLEKHPEFKKHTKKDRFLVGVQDDLPLTIDSYGNVYKGDEEIGDIETMIGINIAKAPLEHAVINVSGYPFPLGVVLCYYYGITDLLKTIKASYRTVPVGTRPKLSADEYAIKFNDVYLIFNRREKLTTLIMGGMPKLNNIGNFSMTDLNNNSVWAPLMGDPRVRPSQFQEMKNLYDLFIDPITRDELKKMGKPEYLHELLIEAARVLEDDSARHEVEIEEQRIVGYERFAGHLYTEMCRKVREDRAKGKGRKHKLEFNPDAVIINIGKDVSTNLVEEVNPMHQLKDQEELTFGGDGGRSPITMRKKTRLQLNSFKGIVSEANKDSGNVGYVTYLTSDPAIIDFRGNIDPNKVRTPTGDGSVTMNLFYGGTHDDAKRVSFSSTQASQAVTAVNYEINTLRTGYENIIPHRVSELYAKIAKDEGVVTEVLPDCLTVTYKDGLTDKYPLGLVIGEASGEYHRHTRFTDHKVGDKFRKGDVIGWDSDWFKRDPFCPGQVALVAGKMYRLTMVEDQDVYEDSVAVSKQMAMEARTPFIKVNRFPVEVVNNLNMKVKVGDKIEQDAILCEIEEPHLVEGEMLPDFQENANKYGIKQIRAKHHGTITKIDVIYNAPIDTMSESIKQLVVKKDKERKRLTQVLGKGADTNAISGAFNVNRPVLAQGKAYIMIYIEALDASTNADKWVFGNQMKMTTGRIMDRELKTESGKVVDAKVSCKGAFNRMVLSFRNKLVTNELSYAATQQFINIYRGK